MGLCQIKKLLHSQGNHQPNQKATYRMAEDICKAYIQKGLLSKIRASQVALVVKNSPANAGDIRDPGSIPRLGRSTGGGHGNPLQYSCLENPMDRRAWQAIVHRVTKSQT